MKPSWRERSTLVEDSKGDISITLPDDYVCPHCGISFSIFKDTLDLHIEKYHGGAK